MPATETSAGSVPERVEGAVAVFAALGDDTRLYLVGRLSSDGPMSIARLAAGASVTRQAVSKHLQVLAGAGLARSTRSGRESIWALEPERLETARQCIDRISAQWDEALGRLKDFVDS